MQNQRKGEEIMSLKQFIGGTMLAVLYAYIFYWSWTNTETENKREAIRDGIISPSTVLGVSAWVGLVLGVSAWAGLALGLLLS
jgi:hypothetical protein